MTFKLFKKYILTEKKEKRIFNQTLLWLIISFLLVRVIPLKWYSKLLGDFKHERLNDLNFEQKQIVENLVKSIKRCKKHLPWKVKCFDESITAKRVLKNHNIISTLYLGVDKNKNEKLIAHAWVKVGEKVIVGEKAYQKFKVVGFFS